MRPRPHLVALFLLVLAPAPGVSAADLTISCGAVGMQYVLCREGAERWAERTGHTVRVDKAPSQTDERLQRYRDLLSRGSPAVDVLQVDVIWPGLLAEHLADLRRHIPEEVILQHYPGILANNTVDGRLVAMPWYVDVGLLFYRKDLLARYEARVPETYSELMDTALRIQTAERADGEDGRSGLWGFVFQGEAYEGLTCNALEWIAAHGGGSFLDPDGRVTVNNPRAATALRRAATWVGTIAPERVVHFREEDARYTFGRGDAVFMRNWPYAWNMLDADPNSPVAGKVGIAPLPRGNDEGRRASTLGGWQLAVSRYSEHPALAADLVRFLTSPEEQRRRAVDGSYAPTIRSLYDDPAVLRASPVFAALPSMLEAAVARPASQLKSAYPQATRLIWDAVNGILAGESGVDATLQGLSNGLEALNAAGTAP